MPNGYPEQIGYDYFDVINTTATNLLTS